MPQYDVLCRKCNHEYNDIWKKMNDVYQCPECGEDCEVLITAPNIIPDNYMSYETAFGYYDENIGKPGYDGCLVESRSHRKKLMKENGLYEK